MSGKLRGRAATVAVVDAHNRGVCVWWVSTALDGDAGMSRKVGAWKLTRGSESFARDFDAILFERMAVATKAGLAAVQSASVLGVRWVDLDATLAAVIAIRDEYQQLFDAEQSTRAKSKQMRGLTWPELPEPINLEKPPPARGQSADAQVGKALAIAAWLDQLVCAFEEIEAIRADRAMLRDAFAVREFPTVLA